MYDYWKRMRLVSTVKLNKSVAQAMRATSSIEEWKSRGTKLFDEENFDMATLCFEKAGDQIWESKAKAFGLKKLAYELKGVDPDAFVIRLKEAAQMFKSIGEDEHAVGCNREVEEYEGRVKDKKQVKRGANPERTADEQKDGDIVDSCVDLNWKFLKDIASCIKGNKKMKPNQFRNAEKIREQVEHLMYSVVALLPAGNVNKYPDYEHPECAEDINVHRLGMLSILNEVWVLGNLFSTSLSDQGPDYDTILNENGLEDVLRKIREKRPGVDKHWKEIKKLVPEQTLKKCIKYVQLPMGKANTWNHKVHFQDGVAQIDLNL